MTNAKEAVISAIKNFTVENGRPPTTILVDAELEAGLALLTAGDVGNLVGTIVVGGPREAFRDGLLGFKVIWDSNSFRVE